MVLKVFCSVSKGTELNKANLITEWSMFSLLSALLNMSIQQARSVEMSATRVMFVCLSKYCCLLFAANSLLIIRLLVLSSDGNIDY